MYLLILIYFQGLGFHSTEWFTNSNLISADLPSHFSLPSFSVPFNRISQSLPKGPQSNSTRDILSLSSDYILSGFMKQGV